MSPSSLHAITFPFWINIIDKCVDFHFFKLCYNCRHCNAVYNQNPIDRWMKGCIPPFPKKGDLGLPKNYRGITHSSIAAKIYNALLRNRIEPKIDNILRKNQNGFRRNRSTSSQILTLRSILEGIRVKNLQATLQFDDFTKAFVSILSHTAYQKKPSEK